jgi:AcrR family transcriptional regulator
VSPRRQDPSNRTALLKAAARLIAQGGPQSLSARRLAAATGLSTMAVYTYFGSMNGIAREIAREGFERLQRLFLLVEPTDDPVADLAMHGQVYRYNAVTSAHVFEVMFGVSNLNGFMLTDDDRQQGRYTLGTVVECVRRCIAAGRFRPDDPVLIAHQMWISVHGTSVLELGRYLVPPYDGDRFLGLQLVSLMVGAGDERAHAESSVATARDRFTRSFGPGDAEAAGPPDRGLDAGGTP